MTKPTFVPLEYSEKNSSDMVLTSEDFYQEMKRRRTVRDFSDRPVPEEVIQNAIRVAGTAPNGANLQPWHFVVVSNMEIKKRIREAAEEEEKAFYHQRATKEWLQALEHLGTDEKKPFLILVAGYPAKDAKVPKISKYDLEDIATFVRNRS